MKDYDIKKDLDNWLQSQKINLEPGKPVSYELLFAAWKARELLDQKLLQEINTLQQNLDYVSQKSEERIDYLVEQIIEIAKSRTLLVSEDFLKDDINKEFGMDVTEGLICPRCESKTRNIYNQSGSDDGSQKTCDKCLHWTDQRVTDYLDHLKHEAEDDNLAEKLKKPV